MRYEYTLVYQDYLDAQKLYRKHRWRAAATYYVFIWVLPILGLLGSFPLIATFLGYNSYLTRSLAPISGIGLWLALYFPLMRIYSIRKCWKLLLPEHIEKSTKSEIVVALEITPEQLISVIPGKSEGRFFWSGILDFVEDEQLALIFIKKKLFIFIPHRAMDEAGWSELRMRFNSSRTAA